MSFNNSKYRIEITVVSRVLHGADYGPVSEPLMQLLEHGSLLGKVEQHLNHAFISFMEADERTKIYVFQLLQGMNRERFSVAVSPNYAFGTSVPAAF